MLSCREVSALVSKALDKQLTLSERLAVRMHLLYCSGCRNFQKHSLVMRKYAKGYVDYLQDKSGGGF